jgi:DNA-binding NtrC family response regulator
MEPFRIFIVEDDPWYSELLAYHFSDAEEYEVSRFADGRSCLKSLHQQPDLITVDYRLPDMNGLELFDQLRRWNPQVPIVIISGQEDVKTALELLRKGVYEYLLKDDNTRDTLLKAVLRAKETKNLRNEIEQLKAELGKRYDFGQIIQGNSSVMQKVFELMEKAAQAPINVTITGETGTGKELVARAIHYNSSRKSMPFLALNMAAIPAELMESELFGHEKGAFTGATQRKNGRFEEAQGGTLFLDEIGEIPLTLQSKLLRVLQEREVTRVGGSEKIKLDVRLIVATHRNLQHEIQQGNFREDLYYRIIGLPIHLPPLRERGGDVLLLARYFLDEFLKQNNLRPKSFTRDAMQKMQSHSFPGNVRELKSVVELAAVMSGQAEIQSEELSFAPPPTQDFLSGEEKTLREYELMIIRHYLRKYDQNVLKVSQLLDIGKSTIYNLLKNREV